MKNFVQLLFCIALFNSHSNAQSLGGYDLADNLVSVSFADTCYNSNFITGFPDDSLWVNMVVGSIVEGTFGSMWIDQVGPDLLLETGYHDVNYEVKLLLSSGLYSAIHNVMELDWISTTSIDWTYNGACIIDSQININHYVLPLDFISDFGLSPSDNVIGIQIKFLTTPGSPDFAGAYIIAPPCSTTSSQLSIQTCQSYTSPSGSYIWDTTGTYIDTIPNSGGCDSIIYIGLIIHDSVNTTVSLTTSNTVTAEESGASYQWVECPSMSIIPGATGQNFTATANGDYAVIVSKNGCVDTSECLTVAQVGISENNLNESFSFFPNPSNGQITFVFDDFQEQVHIQLVDISGKVIHSSSQSGKIIEMNYRVQAGVYFFFVKSRQETGQKRVVFVGI